MASKYLKNFYQDDGYYYTSNTLGMKQPVNYTPGQFTGIGGQTPSWQAGDSHSTVHDTLNNKYYGTQSFEDITKGLQRQIERTQERLDSGYVNRTVNAGTMWERHEKSKLSDKEIKTMTDSITSNQDYLNTITKDNYTQEEDTFFDSYETYTQDYDNLYERRHSNAIQEKKNRQTARRNQTIKGENDLKAAKGREGSSVSTGSGARAKALTPNLQIGTGLTASAYRGLTKSGLDI